MNSFSPGRVRLAQADREPDDPPPIVRAEAAVVVARRMLGFVFLPQQVERHPFAPQFAVRPTANRVRDDPGSTAATAGKVAPPATSSLIPAGSGQATPASFARRRISPTVVGEH